MDRRLLWIAVAFVTLMARSALAVPPVMLSQPPEPTLTDQSLTTMMGHDQPPPAPPPPAAPDPPDAVRGPDGSLQTRDNYPVRIAERAIVVPRGMFYAWLTGDVPVYESTPGVFAHTQPDLALEAGYGFGHGIEAGVNVGAWSAQSVGAYSLFQLSPNSAINVTGGYTFNSGPPSYYDGWNASVGIPFKFLVPHLPLAIGFLNDTVALEGLHYPAIGNELARDRFIAKLNLPVSVTYSPFDFLTVSGGATGLIVLADLITETIAGPPSLPAETTTFRTTWVGDAIFFASVAATFRNFTAQLSVNHYLYFQSPNAEATFLTLGLELRI